MPDTYNSCGQWFSLLILSSKFLFPLSAEWKELENEEKNINSLNKQLKRM